MTGKTNAKSYPVSGSFISPNGALYTVNLGFRPSYVLVEKRNNNYPIGVGFITMAKGNETSCKTIRDDTYQAISDQSDQTVKITDTGFTYYRKWTANMLPVCYIAHR